MNPKPKGNKRVRMDKITYGSRERIPTLQALDAVSRVRPLTDDEALQLERAIRRTSVKRENWHWTAGDIRRLREYLNRGKRPAQIAILMGRTERAVWTRIYRLSLSVRGKSSMAYRVAKGEGCGNG